MIIIDFLLFIGFCVLLFIFYVKYKFSYWKRLGVAYIEPRFPNGNTHRQKEKNHAAEHFAKFYNKLKGRGKFGGLYFFTTPTIILTDLDFAKNVMIKDFKHFHDHGMFYNVKDDPLSGNLINVEGKYWKMLRDKLNPTFSTGRMRQMAPLMVEVASKLEAVLAKTIETNPEPEFKDILACFSTDIIGTCAIGIECSSLEGKNKEFRQMSLKAFTARPYSLIAKLLKATNPDLARWMGFKSTHDDVTAFFLKIVKDVVEYREANNVKRHDIMDLLLQLKNVGHLAGEENESGEKNVEKLTFNEIAAQVFVIFVAGYETSSTTMTFCLHELSMNQELQDKARKNVLEVLARHDGKITYDAINEMTYLEQCISETLRKYPPVGNTLRKVTQDYHVPDSKIVLKKGLMVLTNIFGIHRDPEYYPNPDIYDPERFSQENIAKRHPMAYIPFGEGPRICIGWRFGNIEVKIGMATLLSKFKFFKSERTTVPLRFSKKVIVLVPEGGLHIRCEKI